MGCDVNSQIPRKRGLGLGKEAGGANERAGKCWSGGEVKGDRSLEGPSTHKKEGAEGELWHSFYVEEQLKSDVNHKGANQRQIIQ